MATASAVAVTQNTNQRSGGATREYRIRSLARSAARLSFFSSVSGGASDHRTADFRRADSPAVPQPASQQFMKYSSGLGGDSSANGDSSSTRLAADPDTHQDFQPTSKSSNMSFDDIVARDIKENPVLIYMKGYPDAPRCGFSALAVKVLKTYDVPITGRDILGDLKLKESVKAHTNWPTFPQVFIKGEFVGGSDIILDMHQASELIVPSFHYQKGQLKDILGDIAQKGEQNESS
uniref:Glutaredoxin domain-containing protein n=1 Tax=Leersia perrieri TaxID=77586 RepID=A0A0D9UXE5_9ORYZ